MTLSVRDRRMTCPPMTFRRVLMLTCGVWTAANAQRSVGVIVSNIAVGALIGSVGAHIAKRSVVRGLTLGGVGGLLSASGRQLVSDGTRLSWWSARVVNAVGSAVSELAVADTFSVRFSAGALDLAVVPRAKRHVRARLNAAATLFAVVALSQSRSHILWRESLETGALTVIGPSNDQRATAQPGLIHLPVNGYLQSMDGARRQRLDIAHELVHVMQFDALQQLVGTPLERRLASATHVTRGLNRWLDFGVTGPAIAGAAAWALPYRHNPFEIEAWSAANGRAAPRSP